MTCDCITKIDDKLRERNLKLTGYTFTFSEDMAVMDVVPTIATGWWDKAQAPKGKKNSPTKMLASFCPFCGEPVKSDTLPDGKRESNVRSAMASQVGIALGIYHEASSAPPPPLEALVKAATEAHKDAQRLDYLSDPKNPFNFSIKSDGLASVREPIHCETQTLRVALDLAIQKQKGVMGFTVKS